MPHPWQSHLPPFHPVGLSSWDKSRCFCDEFLPGSDSQSASLDELLLPLRIQTRCNAGNIAHFALITHGGAFSRHPAQATKPRIECSTVQPSKKPTPHYYARHLAASTPCTACARVTQGCSGIDSVRLESVANTVAGRMPPFREQTRGTPSPRATMCDHQVSKCDSEQQASGS